MAVSDTILRIVGAMKKRFRESVRECIRRAVGGPGRERERENLPIHLATQLDVNTRLLNLPGALESPPDRRLTYG